MIAGRLWGLDTGDWVVLFSGIAVVTLLTWLA
jgi:hypothetical protein